MSNVVLLISYLHLLLKQTHDDGDFGKTIDVEENENLNDAGLLQSLIC